MTLTLSSGSQLSDEKNYRHSLYASGSSLDSELPSIPFPLPPPSAADNTQECNIEKLQKENEELKSRLEKLLLHNEELKAKNEKYKRKIERMHKVVQEKESPKRIVQGSLIPTKGPDNKSQRIRSFSHGALESIEELKSEFDKRIEVFHSSLDDIVQIFQEMQEPNSKSQKSRSLGRVSKSLTSIVETNN